MSRAYNPITNFNDVLKHIDDNLRSDFASLRLSLRGYINYR